MATNDPKMDEELVVKLTRREVSVLATAADVAMRSGKMLGALGSAEDDFALVGALMKLRSVVPGGS